MREDFVDLMLQITAFFVFVFRKLCMVYTYTRRCKLNRFKQRVSQLTWRDALFQWSL